VTIVRIDSDTTHGWQARAAVTGRRNGISMLCSDGVHGGREQALKVAKAAERLLQLQALVIERQRVAVALRGWKVGG
jgi:hypothetical protein